MLTCFSIAGRVGDLITPLLLRFYKTMTTRADNTRQIPAVVGEWPDITDACCKVQRVTKAYQLQDIDYELKRRYEDGDATLHELAKYLNNRITTVTLEAVDYPDNIEPSTARAALTNEESIKPTRRDDIRATLAGVLDIELLTDAYISHETVRRHLNEHLDISTSQGGFDTFEELQNALESYQEQYKDGVQSALERAGKKGLIEGTEYQIFTTRVECQQCSETYRLQELLENGGCDCNHDG